MAKVSFSKPQAPTAPAAAPAVAAPAATTPVIDVAATVVQQPVTPAPAPAAPVTQVIQTPTPVPGVTVQSTITAAPAGPAPVTPTVSVAITGNGGAPAAAEGTTVYQKQAFFDDESFDARDMILPRLNIVQNVGELANVHPRGAIILNGQLILAAAPAPPATGPFIRIVFLGFQPTVYTEKVQGGLRGLTVKTVEEVIAKGGTIDYNEAKQTKKPLFQDTATAMVLIEQVPGLDDASFPLIVGGKRHALALYTMKGTSYTHVTKPVKSAKSRTTSWRRR